MAGHDGMVKERSAGGRVRKNSAIRHRRNVQNGSVTRQGPRYR
jgi:hypothetical protein